MLFKCSNIGQSQFSLQIEPCKGKVFKCISVAAHRSWCRTVDFSNASTTARFERDVDIFSQYVFNCFIAFIGPEPMQATRPRCAPLGTPRRDPLLLFMPRYCLLLLFNQACCCSVVPVRTLEHCSVLNVRELYCCVGVRGGHCRWRRAPSTRLTCNVAAWLG